METERETIEKQLEILHKRDAVLVENRTNVKNWCITVWAGAFAILATQRASFEATTGALFLVVPVLIFWIVEGIYSSMTQITIRQGIELERRLAEEDYAYESPEEIFAFSRFSGTSGRKMIKYTMVGTFVPRTMFVFYLLLLVVSIVGIVWLF